MPSEPSTEITNRSWNEMSWIRCQKEPHRLNGSNTQLPWQQLNCSTLRTQALRNAVYVNDSLLGRGKFINKSSLKIGRPALPYRIGPTFSRITFDWIGSNLSDNALKRELKKQCFKYYIVKPIPPYWKNQCFQPNFTIFLRIFFSTESEMLSA